MRVRGGLDASVEISRRSGAPSISKEEVLPKSAVSLQNGDTFTCRIPVGWHRDMAFAGETLRKRGEFTAN
jgi:hypothetical protein